MGFIHGANRHEEILFPERLDDYIAEENPVRFINAFVAVRPKNWNALQSRQVSCPG